VGNLFLRALWIILFEILPMFMEEWRPKYKAPPLPKAQYRSAPTNKLSKPKLPSWLR
jgi:hypothetical protein